jgi:hypothetical protein
MTYLAERVTERKPYTDKPPVSLPPKAVRNKMQCTPNEVGPW